MPGKSADVFAQQFLPEKYKFSHKVLEDYFGNNRYGKNIIVFCEDNSESGDVIGFVLLRTDTLNHYQKVPLRDTLSPSLRGSTRIVAVGFANADNDTDSEIIVITGEDIRTFDDSGQHPTGWGEFESTIIFDSEPKFDNRDLFIHTLYTFDDCFKIEQAKEKLKKMGY